MIKIYSPIKNSFKLFAKIAKNLKAHCVKTILIDISTQVLKILSFLLPLKVIILLASPGIPGYFPKVLFQFEQKELAMYLTLSALVFFVLYMLLEYFLKHDFYAINSKIDKNTNSEFSGKSGFNLLRRVLNNISNIVFSMLLLSAILLLYPVLALWLIAFSFSVLAIVLIIDAVYSINKNDLSFITYITGGGFIYGFIIIVADYIYYEPPNFLIVIASLIMMRQLLQKITRIILDVVFINAKLGNAISDSSRDLHFMERPESINEVLGLIKKSEKKDCTFQSGYVLISNPLYTVWRLNVLCDQAVKSCLFIGLLSGLDAKSNGVNQIVFSKNMDKLPAPSILGDKLIQGMQCYLLDGLDEIDKIDWTSRRLSRHFQSQLMTIEPTDDIKKNLEGELIKRLKKHDLAQIEGSLSPFMEKNILKLFITSFERVINLINDLPCQLYNENTTKDVFFGKDSLVMLDWSKLGIEPIGAFWPHARLIVNEKELNILDKSFFDAQKIRVDLKNTQVSVVRLCALISSFDRCFVIKDYINCAKLVKLSLSELDLCQ